MRLDFRHDDDLLGVELVREGDAWRITVDGRALELAVTPDGDGGWLVDGAGPCRRLRVAAAGDARHVFCEGRVHDFRLHDPDEAGDGPGEEAGPVLAAVMPGKIVQLLVAEGDRVTAGQSVVIMESMKMETELGAPLDGTVAAIRVAAGQVVAQGEPLLDIAPDPAP